MPGKNVAYFRSQSDPFSRKQRPVFLEVEIVDNIFQWDVLKNMRQIKSYDDMFQAIRALTVEKILKIIFLSKKFLQNESFLSFSLKCFDLSCTPGKDTTI